MKLTQIETVKGKIRASMEENRITSGYTIDLELLEDDGKFEGKIAGFRTDEVSIDEIIEMLTFLKNYTFIQE